MSIEKYVNKQPLVHILAFMLSLIPLNQRSKIKIDDAFLENFGNLSNGFGVIEYLKLSHGIILSKDEPGYQCGHIAPATLDTYLRIVKQNERQDLVKKVRLAHGSIDGIGHEWMEFANNGVFENFVPTLGNPREELIRLGTTLTNGKFYYPNYYRKTF